MTKQQEIIKHIIQNRQTVKTYSDKKILEDDWKSILDAIYWSPSSHGFEPYRVLIIEKNNKLRKELTPIMWNQGVVEESDKLIFFISIDRKSFTNKEWLTKRAMRRFTEIAGQNKEEAIKSSKKMVSLILEKHLGIDEPNGDEWAIKQCYIALGNAMTASTILGIGSTPMEGLEKTKVKSLLIKNKLMNENECVAVCAAFGYPKDKNSYLHYGSNKRVRDSWNKKFKTI